MVGGAWKATVHWVANIWTWMSNFTSLNVNSVKEGYFFFFQWKVPEIFDIYLQKKYEDGCMCVYDWVPLVFTWNYHIVNQLYSNINKVFFLFFFFNMVRRKKEGRKEKKNSYVNFASHVEMDHITKVKPKNLNF